MDKTVEEKTFLTYKEQQQGHAIAPSSVLVILQNKHKKLQLLFIICVTIKGVVFIIKLLIINMLYKKTFNVISSDVFLGIKDVLITKGFTISKEGEKKLRATRGSAWAQLYSFDIRKYPTILDIEIDSANNLSFSYEVKVGVALPTQSDQNKLDQEIQDILKNTEKTEIPESTQFELEKKLDFIGYTKQGAKSLLIISIISFFVFPYLGFVAAVLGTISLFISIKEKLDKKIIILNILAIILGLISFALYKILL